jgi:hypothetical protein
MSFIPFTFELSQDGGKTWETLRLPWNSHPYVECVKYGTYEETIDGKTNMYRKVSK